MRRLQVQVLGGLSLAWEDLDRPGITGALARSLLAYLITYRRCAHTRDLLIGTFWPDLSEAVARQRLSQAIWQINRAFKDQPVLITHGDTIQFNPAQPLWLDLDEFEKPQPEVKLTEPRHLQELEAALEHYRGEFLAGYYEEWVLPERERLRNLYLDWLAALARGHKSLGNYETALGFTQKLVIADPWNEAAHREAMRLCVALGQFDAALVQYERCCKILQAELNESPGPETQALATQIAQDQLAAHSGHLHHELLHGQNLAEASLSALPLIGRERERTALLHYVEMLLDGHGGLILVEGEAGVGKTRLLQAFAQDAGWRGIQVLLGNAEEIQHIPYGPVFEAIQGGLSPLRAQQITAILDPIWSQIVGSVIQNLAENVPALAPPPILEAKLARDRLLNALTQFFAAWGQITPVVMILENLHWMDDASLGLIAHLGERLKMQRVLIIGTFRPGDARAYPRLWEWLETLDRTIGRGRLVIHPLDAENTGLFIRRGLGMNRAAPVFENRLYQETQGNPLYILELLRVLLDEKLLFRGRNRDWTTPWDETTTDYTELPIPAFLEKAIARRIHQLLPNHRDALSLCACLGVSFEYQTFITATGLSANAAWQALQELIHRHFIEETPASYRFTHDKIAQVAYEMLPQKNRQQYHRQAAIATEKIAPERIAELARHSFLGHIWEKAVRHKMAAGDQAVELFAYREAVRQYTDGLHALQKLTPGEGHLACRVKLLFARILANERLGDLEAQLVDLAALESCVETASDQAILALRKARYYGAISNFPAMHCAAQDMIRLARQVDDIQLVIKGQVEAAQAVWLQGDYPAAQHQLETAIQAAREVGQPRLAALAGFTLGHIHLEKENQPKALPHYQEARQLFEQIGDRYYLAMCFNALGNVYDGLGNRAESISNYQKSLEMRREMGDQRGAAIVHYNLCVLHRNIGDIHAAYSHLDAMITIVRTMGDRRLEAYGLTYYGLLLEQSDPVSAASHYERALIIRREIGQWALTIDCLAGLARVSLGQRAIPSAQKWIGEALDWIEQNGTDGIGDIILVYQTALDVSNAAGDEVRAGQILETAMRKIWEKLAELPDIASRIQLVNHIPQYRIIYTTYQDQLARRNGHTIPTRLPKGSAPTGRSLREDEWVEIIWTAYAPEDETISGKSNRRRIRLKRLLEEAAAQGAAPTIEDLSAGLDASAVTIKRDLAALREAGIPIRTRGSRSLRPK